MSLGIKPPLQTGSPPELTDTDQEFDLGYSRHGRETVRSIEYSTGASLKSKICTMPCQRSDRLSVYIPPLLGQSPISFRVPHQTIFDDEPIF